MNIQRKICRLLYLSAFVVLMAACHKSNSPGDRILIESKVGHVDLYGGLVPAFKPHELKAAGVEYGDLTMPYVLRRMLTQGLA